MVRALGEAGSTQRHLCEADDMSDRELYVFGRLFICIYSGPVFKISPSRAVADSGEEHKGTCSPVHFLSTIFLRYYEYHLNEK
jgi:hypothetical protein